MRKDNTLPLEDFGMIDNPRIHDEVYAIAYS